MSGKDLVLLGNVLFWVGLLGFGLWCIVQTTKDREKIGRALRREPLQDRPDWTDEDAYLAAISAELEAERERAKRADAFDKRR